MEKMLYNHKEILQSDIETEMLLVRPHDTAYAKLPCEFVIRSPHCNYQSNIITELRTW
jgi:hypothetical protein